MATTKGEIKVPVTLDDSKVEEQAKQTVKKTQKVVDSSPVMLDVKANTDSMKQALDEIKVFADSLQRVMMGVAKTLNDSSKKISSPFGDIKFDSISHSLSNIENILARFSKALVDVESKGGQGTDTWIRGLRTVASNLTAVNNTLTKLSNANDKFGETAAEQVENINKGLRTLKQNVADAQNALVDFVNSKRFQSRKNSSGNIDDYFAPYDENLDKQIELKGNQIAQTIIRNDKIIQSDFNEFINYVTRIFAKGADEVSKYKIKIGEDIISLSEVVKKLSDPKSYPGFSDEFKKQSNAALASMAKNLYDINSETKILERQQGILDKGFKVNIDTDSLTALSKALDEFNQHASKKLTLDEGTTIGIKQEDIQRVVDSFISLKTVLEEIKVLIQGFNTSSAVSNLQNEAKAAEELAKAKEQETKAKKKNSEVSASAEKATKAVGTESQKFTEVEQNATKAAQAKDAFSKANQNVVKSVADTLVSLKNERDGFKTINTVLDGLTKRLEANKVDSLTGSINKLRESLNAPVAADGLIKSLSDLAKSGVDMQAMSDALKNATVKNTKNLSKASSADEVALRKKIESSYAEEERLLEKIYSTYQRLDAEESKEGSRSEVKIAQLNGEIDSLGKKLKILREIRDAEGLKDETLENNISSKMNDLSSRYESIKQAINSDATNKQSVKSYAEILSYENKIYDLKLKIDKADATRDKNANVVKAQFEPIIASYEKEIELLKQEQEQKGLSSSTANAALDREIAKLEQRNSVLVESARAATQAQMQNDATVTVDKYIDQLTKLANSSQYTKAFRDEISATVKNFNTFKTEIQSLNADELSSKLDKIKSSFTNIIDRKNFADSKAVLAKDLSDLELRLSQFAGKNTAMSSKFKREIDGIRERLQKVNNETDFNNIVDQVNKLKIRITDTGQTGLSVFDQFLKRIKSLSQSALGRYFSLYAVIGYVRKAVTTIKELDTQLIDLKKTTAMTGQELNEFYYDANNVAKQMGVTTSEIIQQAAAWSRLNKIGLLCGNV